MHLKYAEIGSVFNVVNGLFELSIHGHKSDGKKHERP